MPSAPGSRWRAQRTALPPPASQWRPPSPAAWPVIAPQSVLPLLSPLSPRPAHRQRRAWTPI